MSFPRLHRRGPIEARRWPWRRPGLRGFRAFIGAAPLKQRDDEVIDSIREGFRAFIGAAPLKLFVDAGHCRILPVSAPSSARPH